MGSFRLFYEIFLYFEATRLYRLYNLLQKGLIVAAFFSVLVLRGLEKTFWFLFARLFVTVGFFELFYSLRLLLSIPKNLILTPLLKNFSRNAFFIEVIEVPSSIVGFYFLEVPQVTFYFKRFVINDKAKAFIALSYDASNELKTFQLYSLVKRSFYSRNLYSVLMQFSYGKTMFVLFKSALCLFWIVQFLRDLLTFILLEDV